MGERLRIRETRKRSLWMLAGLLSSLTTGCKAAEVPEPPRPEVEPVPLECDPGAVEREAPRQALPFSNRLNDVLERTTPKMKEALLAKGLCLGQPLFLRIFKAEHRLEVWVQRSAQYVKFQDYSICSWSGVLGPKEREGDHQAPEGFYQVGPGQMNPNSSFHLSFNLGYPNVYERAKGWTGSALMVHGNCVSIGCYAITDPGIEEVYTLAHYALRSSQQRFPVHVFPFELTDAQLEAHRDSEWYAFWRELKPGYDRFEQQRNPPEVRIENGRYLFR